MGFLDMLRGRQTMAPLTSYAYRMSIPDIRAAAGMGPEKLYRESPPLRAVLDFRAAAIAQLPLKVYVRKDDGDRVRDTTSVVARTLARPNAYMTPYELFDALSHDTDLYGFGLWFPVESKDSESGFEIEYIPASWIKSYKSDGFRVTEYLVHNPELTDTEPKWMKADDFIQFGSYDPVSPSLPSPPVEALRDVLTEQINASKFRNQVWANGGRISGIIKQDPTIQWSPELADRMEKAVKESFTGDGAKAGGIAYLGPGTTIEQMTFNAREAEWAEAERMARQDVAAVYNVNPAMVWSGEGQSYASSKENARSLYTETLAPALRMIEDRINAFLLPVLGAAPGTYVEFDLQAKLAGSFEEQAAVMSQAVGAPWLTREEARARMNLPRLEGQDADKLITPLNVLVGGQASPHDTDTSMLSGLFRLAAMASDKDGTAEVKEQGEPKTVLIKGTPSVDDAQAITLTFQKFFRRQGKSVISQIDRARDKGTLHETKAPAVADPVLEIDETLLREWFDLDRWDKELRDDLRKTLARLTLENMTAILDELNANPGAYDEEYVMEYVERLASELAHDTNMKTLEELVRAVDDADSFSTDDALKSTPQGVFEFAETKRATDQGATVSTNIRGWSSIAAIHVGKLQARATKTWRVTSHNPRPSHMRLNGETIPYANPDWERDPDSDNYRKPGYGEHSHFSNGCRFPGDFNRNVKEVAGCRCEMDVEVRM